jgi:DNA repair protein RadC
MKGLMYMSKSVLTMKEIPLTERPYEKAEKLGILALSDAELLAIILQSGQKGVTVVELSHKVLLEAGSIDGLFDMSLEELRSISGIGRVKALNIKAALELGQRATAKRAGRKRHKVHGPNDLFAYIESQLRFQPREQFFIIMLDTRNRIIRHVLISSGGLSSSVIQPRDIFREAVKANAAAIVLVHNHPSGDAMPSEADRTSTQRLSEMGQMMGVQVLDHIVVGSEGSMSLRALGLM